MDERCKSFQEELEDLFEKHCIETVVIIWRDPDTCSSLHFHNGEMLWNIGAVGVVEARLKQQFIQSADENDQENEDDERPA